MAIDEQAEVVQGITVDTLQHFLDHSAFASGRIEGIIVGNVDARAASDIASAARSVFSTRNTRAARPAEFERWRAVALPEAARVAVPMAARSAAERNSAHLSLWQARKQCDDREDMLFELAAHIMKRSAFHQLRTVEQIGYIVWSYASGRAGVPHIAFLLQSTVLGAGAIGGRVRAFLRQWRDLFEVCCALS